MLALIISFSRCNTEDHHQNTETADGNIVMNNSTYRLNQNVIHPFEENENTNTFNVDAYENITKQPQIPYEHFFFECSTHNFSLCSLSKTPQIDYYYFLNTFFENTFNNETIEEEINSTEQSRTNNIFDVENDDSEPEDPDIIEKMQKHLNEKNDIENNIVDQNHVRVDIENEKKKINENVKKENDLDKEDFELDEEILKKVPNLQELKKDENELVEDGINNTKSNNQKIKIFNSNFLFFATVSITLILLSLFYKVLKINKEDVWSVNGDNEVLLSDFEGER